LDGTSGAISALPAIVDAVGDDVAVILDGGVRRGSDIAKALALGARMTFTARPYICALAVGGAPAVEALCEIYRRELRDVLALLGCDSVESLGPDLLEKMSAPGREQLEGQRT
jgi:isopentenyl diphosphate isomerase/L-lactate dehydrogenase-like FMN-dependent dehydrogenase